MIRYTVTSSTEDEVSVEATVAGQTVIAKVPGLVVEMTSEDGGMGHTYRFRPNGPEEMAAAQAKYAVGNVLDLDFIEVE